MAIECKHTIGRVDGAGEGLEGIGTTKHWAVITTVNNGFTTVNNGKLCALIVSGEPQLIQERSRITDVVYGTTVQALPRVPAIHGALGVI